MNIVCVQKRSYYQVHTLPSDKNNMDRRGLIRTSGTEAPPRRSVQQLSRKTLPVAHQLNCAGSCTQLPPRLCRMRSMVAYGNRGARGTPGSPQRLSEESGTVVSFRCQEPQVKSSVLSSVLRTVSCCLPPGWPGRASWRAEVRWRARACPQL